MKNIAVFSGLVIIFFAITVNNSYCQDLEKERNYTLSFGTQFGFIHGQALELVYPVSGETKGELLSELKWDMKPVFYYGIKFDFSRIDLMRKPGFFAEVSFKAGVPADSGSMEDRDWMSSENNALTHFSSHTNNTGELYWLDAAIGASFPVKSFFYIKPFINGSWMRFSFTGRDGYKKYARSKPNNPTTYYPIDDNPDEEKLSGNAISYQQNWLLIAAGFSIGTNILHPFSFDLSFQISPLTYCAAIDNHLDERKRIEYKDFTSLGLFFEPKGSFSFNLEKLVLSLEFAYRYIGRTHGDTYQKGYNEVSYTLYPEQAGASLSMKDLSFIVKLKL